MDGIFVYSVLESTRSKLLAHVVVAHDIAIDCLILDLDIVVP